METASILISIAALVFSVASPAITAYLNNRHQLKMKRIEFNMEHRAQVIENYIRATGETIFTHKPTSAQYGTYYGEIFLYVPSNLWPLLVTINGFFTQGRYDEAQIDFLELCYKLAELEVRPDVQPKRSERFRSKAGIKRKHTAP